MARNPADTNGLYAFFQGPRAGVIDSQDLGIDKRNELMHTNDFREAFQPAEGNYVKILAHRYGDGTVYLRKGKSR